MQRRGHAPIDCITHLSRDPNVSMLTFRRPCLEVGHGYRTLSCAHRIQSLSKGRLEPKLSKVGDSLFLMKNALRASKNRSGCFALAPCSPTFSSSWTSIRRSSCERRRLWRSNWPSRSLTVYSVFVFCGGFAMGFSCFCRGFAVFWCVWRFCSGFTVLRVPRMDICVVTSL